MLTPRQIAALAAVIAALVVTIGINRIVVTDGAITAAAPAFKSDYLPLER